MYQYIYVQFNFVEKKKSNNATPWTETRSKSCMCGCLKKLDFFILHIISMLNGNWDKLLDNLKK